MNLHNDLVRKLDSENIRKLTSLLPWLVLMLSLENTSQAQKQAIPDTKPNNERLPEKNKMT